VAFTAPITSETHIGDTVHIGDWAADWDRISSFEFSGTPYLLFYRRSDGGAFTAPILSPSQIGPLTGIGRWEQDWAQIVPYRFNGAPYLLFYRDTGPVFSSPILSGTQIGATTSIGTWENDWLHIVSIRANGSPFFLLYRSTGSAYAGPIVSPAAIGNTAHLGDWANDWSQLLSFDIRTTTNYAYAYDPILKEAEVVNADHLLATLAETSEGDFLKLQSLFRTSGGFGPGNHILVWVTNQIVAVKGGHNFGWGPVDRKTQISISAAITDPTAAKSVLVAELAEIFMSYQNHAYNNPSWNSGDSKGEALSLLCAELLYPNPGFVGDRVTSWMNDKSNPVPSPTGTIYARANWIDATKATDSDPISYGCGMLFMYWLNTVKKIGVADIIAAKGSTFAALYTSLTGQSDGWSQFHAAVDKLYPETNNPNFVWKRNDIFL
jgi:hypothetical protein